MKKVAATVTVAFTDEEYHRIFLDRLRELKQGMWVRDGKLWEEHVTSHRFDAVVGDSTHKEYRLVEAIQNLEDALKESNRERTRRV